MSVTFHPAVGAIDHHVVECLNCRATQRFDDADAAFDVVRRSVDGMAALPDCDNVDPEDCYSCGYASIAHAVEADGPAPTVNMSNTNARHILSLLGLTTSDSGEDLWGGLAAEDLLGRALIALAVAPADAGVPAHEVVGSGAQFIDCGRPAGYSEDRLRRIAEVAQWAADHGREVEWE